MPISADRSTVLPWVILLALLSVLGVCAAASAQPGDEGPVKLRAVPQFDSVVPGGRLVVAIEFDHGDEFHTWPAKEVDLPANIAEFAIRTEIGFPKDEDDKPLAPPAWIAGLDGVQFPPAKPGKVADPTGEKPTVTVPLYSHKAVAYVRLHVSPTAAPVEQTVTLRFSYQACDDKMCTMPQDASLPVKVRVAAAGAGGEPKANEPALFEKFDASKWGPAPKPVPTGSGASGAKPAAAAPASGPSSAGASLFGIDLGGNIFILALAAALGGFVLNLTPCVLPVIPIKVMTLTQHAGSKSHALALGLWMAGGVVAFWGAIGIPMAFVSANLDPSQFIFGIWWITLAIGLVIALMGLGIMGLFTLNLPQSVYMVEAKADSPFGSFLFGVMTAVLGLPCFGFVAGGLLAAAATLPASAIMTIFVGMGVGMAAPYLVLSVYPDLLKFIPRTGPASELVKQVMGILLLAAAAFFVAAGIQALLKERPYLAGSMTWWAVGFFVAIASVWMVIRTLQIAKSPIMKVFIPVLGVVMTLGIGVFAQGRLMEDHEAYVERERARAEMTTGGGGLNGASVPAGVWLDYTPELFAAVRGAGRPVFLDFTADWCITCKALKAAVLDPMKPVFKQRGLVVMEVDCTVKSSLGSKLLRELQRTGVPQWAVYGAKDQEPRWVDITKPTQGTVIEVLNAAGIVEGAAVAGSVGETPTR